MKNVCIRQSIRSIVSNAVHSFPSLRTQSQQPVQLTLANLTAHNHATSDHHSDDEGDGRRHAIVNVRDVFARVQRFANSPMEVHREVNLQIWLTC